MPTLGELADRVLVQLYDSNEIHWSKSEVVDALNEAVGVLHRTLVVRGADSLLSGFRVTKQISLTAGAEQQLPVSSPDKGARFLRVHTAKGRALTPFSLDIMAAIDPDWQSATGDPKQYASDDDPTKFWVYPPAAATDSAVVSYVAEPEALTTTSQVPFDGKFDQALIDFALYRAYSKDTEYAGQDGRASMHYRAFKDGINGTGQ